MKKYILLLIVPFLMFSQEETPDIWHFSNENNSGSCIKGDCENGYGIYQWHSGEKYEGEFKKWELLSGVLIFTNGDRYEGSFVFNDREGYGIYTYSNGDKYEGEWEMDDIDGEGKMVYKYGYSGKLSDIKEICDCSNASFDLRPHIFLSSSDTTSPSGS